ncbi:LAFE_0C07184g1_1 [Lachancea fermentati]|uniref:Ubiquitin-like protein ATG12 n=1 Tax=Lachancea fermentati TaxID=4955 RepID=A0A1G4M9M9_LACFM|nr:LAFE_0C07184g1_1 [Lachancea fermentati]
MSQLIESESDEGTTSSEVDNGSSSKNSFVVHNELEFFAKKLNQFGLESDEEVESERTTNETGLKLEEHRSKLLGKQITSSTTSKSSVKSSSSNDQVSREIADETSQRLDKVQIKFQSIGSIRQIIPQVARISSYQPFSVVITFLKKKLKVDTVHCYINNSFAPAPQQTVGDLWNQFKVQNELVVNYCSTVAFG